MPHILQKIISLAVLGLATVASAVTVNFDNATLGPSDLLQMGGITVTPYDNGNPSAVAGGQVKTTAGYGLGNTALGPGDEVDSEMQFLPTQSSYRDPSSIQLDGLQFSVEGTINSITLLPVFRAYANGVLLPDQCSFFIYASGNWQGGQADGLDQSSGTPITLSGPNLLDSYGPLSTLNLSVFLDMVGGNAGLFPYEQQDLSETVNVEFGFTVQSMDITPAPEPATVSITGLGLGTLWLLARRKIP